MTCVTGLMVVLVVTLCVSSEQDNETLEVLYPQRNLTPLRGSSIKLSCEANYDFIQCGVVHVVWHHFDQNGTEMAQLTDPSQYFTTVNETDSGGNMRRRQVLTEILKLTSEHNGRYQCKAECVSGETAMGHFISVTLKD